MNKFAITAAFVYLLCMAAVAYGMFTARRSAIRNYGSATAADQWETWRVEAASQSGGEGPVVRRPPKSEKPPALMLMTEHFGTCLALSLLLTSILYATLVVMVRGAAAEGVADDEEETPGIAP
jgi:hypothetical protein